MTTPNGPAAQIQRAIFWLGAATVALFVVVLGLAVVGWYLNHEASARNAKAVKALCTQRHDLDLRITVQQRLLRKHRGEQLIFTIPRGLLESGLKRDQGTRQNLEILDCKE